MPSAVPRDVRPAFSRPPSPSEPGAEVADSHARPIAAPESAERPAFTPAPATRLSSRPPPLPTPGFLPPTPSVPANAAPSFGDEGDDLDERTPVSVTKPSLPFDPGAAGAALMSRPPVVVAGTLDVFDPLLAPLPPPAVIEPPPDGYRTSFGSDGPPSSGPISGPASSGRPPTSVAPPMPQIPKQVLSGRPMVHAPGIVSTQAIPLTVPAKKRGRSPLFVAFAAAIIGGMIALAIALSMKAKTKPDASGDGPEAPPAAAGATLAPAATGASPAGIAPPASTAASSSGAAAPPTAAAPAPAATGRPEASKQGASAPVGPASRPPRKSDRIED